VIYGLIRMVVGIALRLFYRVQVRERQVLPDGPLLFIGNHPNGLIDPALLFVVTPRKLTFLAKAPLFKLPVLGWLIRGMGALPVYRRQDDPSRMAGNDVTLDTAARALIRGGAITIFPEGKSHSAPQLAALKTGAARIALKAREAGADVTVVPVGLTYARKHRFRSEVHVEVGVPLRVSELVPDPRDPDAVRALTDAMFQGLREVTLNLESWEDLPLVETAEELWALRHADHPGDVERLRRFAQGVTHFRSERPEEFEALRTWLLDFRERLRLTRVEAQDLSTHYRARTVVRFCLRMLLSLVLGLPLLIVGFVVYAIPFFLVRGIVRALRPEDDVEATYKLLGALVIFPLWTLGTCLMLGWRLGPGWAALALVSLPLLAVFARHEIEAWHSRVRDIRLFLRLGSLTAVRAGLLREGEELAEAVDLEATRYLEQAADGG